MLVRNSNSLLTQTGVGDDKFQKMDALDADTKPLLSESGKKWASRDIVQFVPFSAFKFNMNMLAEAVLREVPQQVVTYMALNNIVPLQKPPMQ